MLKTKARLLLMHARTHTRINQACNRGKDLPICKKHAHNFCAACRRRNMECSPPCLFPKGANKKQEKRAGRAAQTVNKEED